MTQTSFFNLPLELRHTIYNIALLPLPSDVYNFDESTIYVNFYMPNNTRLSANYWSSTFFQQRLSLLYVNRQIHDEAAHVLYTFFDFCFPYWDLPSYTNTLRRWLTVEPRTKIRKIRLSVTLPIAHNGIHQGALLGSQWQQVLGETLPSLQSVRIAIHFEGEEPAQQEDFEGEPAQQEDFEGEPVQQEDFEGEPVQQEDFEYIVQCVLGTVRPFRHVTELLLENFDNDGSQERQIFEECEQRIEAGGEW